MFSKQDKILMFMVLPGVRVLKVQLQDLALRGNNINQGKVLEQLEH
jgi:hypothetical protein